MRQAGVLAAAGLVALRSMVDRLADDHTRASRLAYAVADRWPDGGLDPSAVRTNIVTWSHPQPDAVLAHLADHGVLAGTIAPGVLRLVTHHDIDDAGLDRACTAIASAPL
jgi:threonine aldolase